MARKQTHSFSVLPHHNIVHTRFFFFLHLPLQIHELNPPRSLLFPDFQMLSKGVSENGRREIRRYTGVLWRRGPPPHLQTPCLAMASPRCPARGAHVAHLPVNQNQIHPFFFFFFFSNPATRGKSAELNCRPVSVARGCYGGGGGGGARGGPGLCVCAACAPRAARTSASMCAAPHRQFFFLSLFFF